MPGCGDAVEVLYDDLWLYIFSFLSYSDLCRVSATCRRFARLSSTNSLWKTQYKKEFYPTNLPPKLAKKMGYLSDTSQNTSPLSQTINSIRRIIQLQSPIQTIPHYISLEDLSSDIYWKEAFRQGTTILLILVWWFVAARVDLFMDHFSGIVGSFKKSYTLSRRKKLASAGKSGNTVHVILEKRESFLDKLFDKDWIQINKQDLK